MAEPSAFAISVVLALAWVVASVVPSHWLCSVALLLHSSARRVAPSGNDPLGNVMVTTPPSPA